MTRVIRDLLVSAAPLVDSIAAIDLSTPIVAAWQRRCRMSMDAQRALQRAVGDSAGQLCRNNTRYLIVQRARVRVLGGVTRRPVEIDVDVEIDLDRLIVAREQRARAAARDVEALRDAHDGANK